jgi:hypothetical protein
VYWVDCDPEVVVEVVVAADVGFVILVVILEVDVLDVA